MIFYKTVLDTQSVKMSGFGTKSVIEKTINIEGAQLTVGLMLYRATRVKEMERVPDKKKAIDTIPPSFKKSEVKVQPVIQPKAPVQ